MIRAFQWDLARQVERRDFLKRQLPRYARWGYDELYLHLEDAVHYPSLPGIGRDDAYAYEEMGELVLAAAQCGIRIVPIVNLLGHTQYLIKHPELRELNELRDEHGDPMASGQICPLHPRTLEVAEKILRDMAPFCTAGKVHVGLDESLHLGRCPRCREEVMRIGLGGHFSGHVHRLHKLVSGLGLQMGIWADMLYFVPDAIPALPHGLIAYDWYYYPFNGKPRVEFHNFAERDLHPALKRRGIHYYGCAMNGAFRYEPLPVFGDRLANIRSWWQRCLAVQAEGFLVTSWEPYRLALETTTVVDAAAASLWLEPGHDDATTMLARGLERAAGSKDARPQARALLAADTHAFTGYARWQINERWDVFAGEDALAPYEAELKFFTRALALARGWPSAFSSSLAFRLYLAKRDIFVRQAARDVFRWRRALAKGNPSVVAAHAAKAFAAAAWFGKAIGSARQAARRMWNRSRDRTRHGQNLAMLETDARRLRAWKAWLNRLKRNPSILTDATPVCGAWQLCFRVHNVEPAVQRVVVEQRTETGWQPIVGRHTIEFRAYAARPRSRIVRYFSAPIPSADIELRIAVRGVGRVQVSHIHFTNGVTVRRRADWARRQFLGRRAPADGFPELESAPATLPIRA